MPPHALPLKQPTERRAALARCLRVAAALGLACVLPWAWSAAAPFELADLMQAMAQIKAGEAVFTETRTVAMLEHPLESSGRLSFVAPDTFVRETLKPRRERVAVVGNNVTMSLGGHSRTVPLDSVPELAVIMEAIRGTLTGNREALERHFEASVSGSPERWSLALVPREASLREQVTSVHLAGQAAHVLEVVVTLADGDRSVMAIEPVAAAARPASGAS